MIFEKYKTFSMFQLANHKLTNAILDICHYDIHSRVRSVAF